MKKLLFITAILVSLGAVAQKKAEPKQINLPAPGTTTGNYGPTKQQEKIFYLVLPQSKWQSIMNMLRRSKAPSDEVDDIVTYIDRNAKELPTAPPAAPVSDTSKPKN